MMVYRFLPQLCWGLVAFFWLTACTEPVTAPTADTQTGPTGDIAPADIAPADIAPADADVADIAPTADADSSADGLGDLASFDANGELGSETSQEDSLGDSQETSADSVADSVAPPAPITSCVGSADGLVCTDFDGCTAGDVCLAGVCTGKLKVCDDADPCTTDVCQGGQCTATPKTECSCKADSDCQPAGGTNLCLGVRKCTDGACITVPGTAVVCLATDNTPCAKRVCQPNSGLCPLTPVDDGTPCGEPVCGPIGLCAVGLCKDATLVNCDDKDACTQDSCDVSAGIGKGCKHLPLSDSASSPALCSDGDPCTAADACENGACVYGPPLGCDDNQLCTDDSCTKNVGCVHNPGSGKPCDDGSACTLGDGCVGGVCLSGPATDCSDANPCTVDSCDNSKGCSNLPADNTPCDDGSACTVDDSCEGGACLPGAVTPCDDADPCTDDSCDAKTGCAHAANSGNDCNDGSACTTGDVCEQGVCSAGGPIVCDDQDVCTDDSCASQSGCQHTPGSGAECSDGSACTAGDTCAKGACKPGAAVDCDDQDVCTADSCKAEVGCIHLPLTANETVAAPCSDGSACTEMDTCVAGSCQGGPAVDCDDQNPCTAEGCDPKTGCTHKKLTDGPAGKAPCDDADACTVADACADGLCLPGAATVCADSDPCTDDSCAPSSGCVFAPNTGSPCDDANACTVEDKCAKGTCTPGEPLDCDDKLACTADSCDPKAGCKHQAQAELCDDGDACTTDGCDLLKGCTTSEVACDDSNPCTDEKGCDKQKGCLYANNTKVHGSCATGQLGACTAGQWHCQAGVGYCMPKVEGLGAIELVSVPGGVLERKTGLVGAGERLITSNGDYLLNAAHGVGGVAYGGWVIRFIDTRNGFAVAKELTIADQAFYADGVVANASHLYAIEWIGDAAGRVRSIDLSTGKVEVVNPPVGDWNVPAPDGKVDLISGQFDWISGQVFVGSLNTGAALRWPGKPWQPQAAPPPIGNAKELLVLAGSSGAGVTATDGTYLYVKRWGAYPGTDSLERYGTGFHGTKPGAYQGRMTSQTPLGVSIAAAYHSDGFVYNAAMQGTALQRTRVSAATFELCDGIDNDCDGVTDDDCHPNEDHCFHAVVVKDGQTISLGACRRMGATLGQLRKTIESDRASDRVLGRSSCERPGGRNIGIHFQYCLPE